MTEIDDMKPDPGDTVEDNDGRCAEVIRVYKNGKIMVRLAFGDLETWAPGEFFVVRRAQ